MSLCLNADEIMHIADAGCDDNSLFFFYSVNTINMTAFL